MNGPLISPRLMNQNYLENLYRKMEARDQMAYNTQTDLGNDLVDQEAQKTTNVSLPLQEERSKSKSPSPPPKILNKDLVMETE